MVWKQGRERKGKWPLSLNYVMVMMSCDKRGEVLMRRSESTIKDASVRKICRDSPPYFVVGQVSF